MRASRSIACLLAAALASACGARGGAFVPPTGEGTPDPAVAAQFTSRTAPCAGISSFAAEAALSGRIGGSRVRGRLHLGVTRTGQLRLEAVAPFGPPIFILAGSTDAATLFLPRERQVLRDTPPADIIEALAGVRLTPTDLLDVSTGCVGNGREVRQSVQYAGGLARVDLAGGLSVWFDTRAPAAKPGLRGASLDGVQVSFLAGGAESHAVRLTRREADGTADVDLRLGFAQQERNVALGPEAFTVDVPAQATAVSLDTLRRSGLLGR